MVNHLRHGGEEEEVRRRRLKAVRKKWGVMVREAKVLHGHTGVRRMRQKAVREEWAALVNRLRS
jgi:hypothetical protein